MALVKNTTNQNWAVPGCGPVFVGETVEVSDEEALILIEQGWTLVSAEVVYGDEPTTWSPRPYGKRGLVLEGKTPYKAFATYVLGGDISVLPKPSGPFGYGQNLQYPMALNDQYGDCTIAGYVHGAQISAEIAGISYAYPGDPAVKNAYFGLTGGTDSGLMLSDVLNAASSSNGLLGMKVVGIATVDVTDIDLLTTVLYNFGWLYLAVNLPASAESDFAHHIPWTLSNPPDSPIGGHCIVGSGTNVLSNIGHTNESVIDVVTWADLTECSIGWWNQYGIQAYVVVPQWYIDVQHDAIAHLDMDQWKYDMDQINEAH